MKIFAGFLILILQINNVFASTPPVEGFADLVDKLTPAVVNIHTTQKPANRPVDRLEIFPEGSPFEEFNDFFERFGLLPPEFDDRQSSRKVVSLGSGFIIDATGFIVTNYHVISEAEEVSVKFSNDRQYKAKIIGYDSKTDLALLKIEDAKPFPYVNFGNSDEARVGEWVIAIGNPFGLGSTVTAGIISAMARDINTGGIVDNFIQTDAAINKGNSGGPMFDMNGEVIGVNTAIFSPSGGNVGIGFATPSSIAKAIIEQLKKTGKVERGFLGVKIQPIDEEIVESLGLENNNGVLVSEVSKGSPAEKAGMQQGDIIISYDGKAISSNRKLLRLVAETPVNKKIELVVVRRGKQQKLHVVLGELKEKNKTVEETVNKEKYDAKNSREVLGVAVANLTDEFRELYAIPPHVNGVVVLKIGKKSDWTKRAIERGDVIMGVNQEPVNNVADFERLVKKAEKDGKKSILFLLNRAGQTIFLTLPLVASK